MKLSSNEEDYLKAVYGLGEWDPRPVTTGAIAARLGVAPASATTMVSKLAGRGLLEHPPYGAVTLTPEGRLAALGVVRRHRLLETFLVGELGYRWDEVHEEAELLEHTVSRRFIDRLDERLGYPAADPHGDPIPAADGTLRLPDAVRLDQSDAGGSAVVVRVSDADPGFLRRCAEAGIVPGNTLDVAGHGFTGEQAAAIWVRPLSPAR
ncbi:metal-dependent transcriptional regulator [Zafaria sp. Z1313]|uniref:metal-dependent transcriptional regulator n=1 Tax=unclassified Zafaria TaxID=2828765 RepID=UPI002E7916D3|nr:metal-dependent transcriptional regulator [Zafaria sp. J156]MEE1622182.1 metal-dependent transcriptional regulator [Zafaria sp. J156]